MNLCVQWHAKIIFRGRNGKMALEELHLYCLHVYCELDEKPRLTHMEWTKWRAEKIIYNMYIHV